jgi:acyl-CoA dehydrogenase
LHALVFPLGKPYKQPDDALGQQVAARLLEPSESRDRLTAGMYLSSNTSEPLGRLEDALEKIIAAEAVERKIRQAVKAGTLDKADEQTLLRMAEKRAVISKDEADVVKAAEAARREVIMVDDFPADYWKRKEN